MPQQLAQEVKDKIRSIKDFPKPGIIFRDITTALKDSETLRKMVDFLCDNFKNEKIDYIIGLESRGFIFGMPVAYNLDAGFIPVRKPNKLPAKTFKESYMLEYGTDSLEVHEDAVKKGDRVLIVDDLLATGGTAAAACNLITQTGADIVGCAFVIELKDLKGREKLPKGVKVLSMVEY
ncbi:MAG: adenine phosphoribosyltransferase [Candidatus Gastranaerophilaceae bacterium]